MKTSMQSFRALSLVLAGAFAAACGPGGSSSTTATVSSVTVTLQDATIPAGIGTTITATAKMSNGSTKDVTTTASWRTSSPATALVACIVSPCPVTTIAAGTATLTATYGGKAGQADLTVSNASLKSITITASSTSFAKGTTSLLSARGVFSDASQVDISTQATWTSSDTSIVSISGTTATGVAAGTATLTATMNGVSGTLSVTVTDAAPQSLAISPVPLNLPTGSTLQLAAIVTYTDGSSTDVASTATWTSSNAAVGAVSTTGVLHGLTQGTATITVTSGSLVASAVANIGAPAIVSISITPTPVVLEQGSTQQLTATALLTDSNTSNVTTTATWSSDDATVVTVSNTGLLTPVANGATTVTATVGDVVGTVSVSVVMAHINSITVTPSTVDLPLGVQQPFAASAHLSSGADVDVTSTATWTSSDPSSAPISAAGVVTASAQTTSAVTITATVGDVSGTAAVTVGAPVISSIAVTSAAPSVVSGFTVQLTATATLTDSTTQGVTSTATWASGDTSLATVSSSGLVTGIAQGSVTFTATQGGKTGQVTVSILPPVITSIAVEPATVSIPLGLKQQLVVRATMSNGAITTVTNQTTWASDDTDGLIATISAAGLVSTVAVSGTSVTFTATVGTHTATSVVTVIDAVVDGISVAPTPVTLAHGETKQLTVTAHFTDDTTQPVTSSATWTSDDTTHAIATISAGGLVSTVAASATPVVFTATYLTFTATATVHVNPAAPVSIAVSPDSASLPAGRTQQLSVQATYTDTTHGNVTGQVTWETSDVTIATVSATGLVTAVAQNGTAATITAHLGTLTSTSTITVTAPVLASVVLSPSPLSLAAGRTQQLAASGVLTDTTGSDRTADATWSSEDDAIAAISTSGLLTATGTGTVIVHATVDGITGDLSVTVTAPVIDGVAIATDTVDLPLGATKQLVLTATYSDLSTTNEAAHATWTSSDESIATVSATGLVTAIAENTTGATITATLGTFSDTATVTVSAPVVASVEVSSATVAAGLTKQLSATAVYTDGNREDITSTATWTSGDDAKATVSSTGLVTGVTESTVTIKAKAANGVEGSATITVSAPELQSIAVSARQTNIPSGANVSLKAVGHFSDGSNEDGTTVVTWSVDDETVATIASNGVVTALQAGPLVVTATYGTVSGTLALTVVAGVDHLTLNYGSALTLPQDLSLDFVVTASLTDASSLDVTALTEWTSDQTPAGAITLSGATVTGAAPGTADLHASVGGKAVSTTITVTLPMTSLAVSPSTIEIPTNLTFRPRAMATLSDSSTVDVSSIAGWSSNDASAIVVGADGTLTPQAPSAQAHITAKIGAAEAQITATASTSDLVSLEVTPGAVTLSVPQTQQLSVTGHLFDGGTLDMAAYVSWSSDDPAGAIATVSNTGLVTAVTDSLTDVTVTASVAGFSAQSVVTVEP